MAGHLFLWHSEFCCHSAHTEIGEGLVAARRANPGLGEANYVRPLALSIALVIDGYHSPVAISVHGFDVIPLDLVREPDAGET